MLLPSWHKLDTEAVQQLADLYETSERTVYRWMAAGVDPRDPEQVATHLLKQSRARLGTLQATANHLSHDEG